MNFSQKWFSALFLVTLLVSSIPSLAFAEESGTNATEEAGSTPLSEFAPDDIDPEPGKRYDQGVTIHKVSIEGNRLIPDRDITENMSIRPGSLYSRNNLKKDLRKIYDMGYFTEKIRAVPVSTAQGIVLRIEVEENAPVTGVSIEGNTAIPEEELQAIFKDQTGLPQNIGELNESIEKIEKLYSDKGYVLARVTSIGDDPDGMINLKINEGKINKIQFVGNRKTRDYVIQRQMTVKEGDIYNEKALGEDLKRVYNSQAFTDVRRVITASPDNPDAYNLTIELDEKRTGAISLGGGVDTLTGFFGSAGFTDPNFLGRGQNFNVLGAVGSGVILRDTETQASARTYQFEVGWSTPSLYNTPNALAANVYGRDMASFNIPLAVERRIGLSSTWSRPLTSFKNMSGSLTVGGENVSLREFADDDDLAEFNIPDDARKKHLDGGTFMSVTPTIAYDTRDNAFDPSRGWFNTFSTTGAMGVGAGSYATVGMNLRKYIKLREGITLALNAQGGSSVIGDIPDFNMFRLGGAQSIRGFQEGGLGLGNGFLMTSAEIRTKLPGLDQFDKLPFLKTMRGVLFADAGTLVGESDLNKYFDRVGYGASVGVGLRVNIPGLGPLRIDYGVPILGGGNDYVRRFSFGVGQKF